MNTQLVIYLMDTSIKILERSDEKITSENILKEFLKLKDGLKLDLKGEDEWSEYLNQ